MKSLAHSGIIALCLSSLSLTTTAAGPPAPSPKSAPRFQAVPQPYQQISFQRDGVEIARYHYSTNLNRPFLFPIIGPSGRSLTRIGHPHDPETHSHHNSIWISHRDVNGVNFWEDGHSGAKIIHKKIERLEDGERGTSLVALNEWTDGAGKVLVTERRRIVIEELPGHEWLLLLDLEFSAAKDDVIFGKTPFGLIGVRMAKTIGVNDGGGTILNSAGGLNEPGVHWKPAKWVDYSGPISGTDIEGLTLLDHPANTNHPSIFHVRNDGWMGASLSYEKPITIARGKTLRLCYEIYVHGGAGETSLLKKRWDDFAARAFEQTKKP
jgi:hypothetical protein